MEIHFVHSPLFLWLWQHIVAVMDQNINFYIHRSDTSIPTYHSRQYCRMNIPVIHIRQLLFSGVQYLYVVQVCY